MLAELDEANRFALMPFPHPDPDVMPPSTRSEAERAQMCERVRLW